MKAGVVILFFFVLSVVHGTAQVSALFSVDTTFIQSYRVLFQAMDTTANYMFVWDFGDATGDTGPAVVHQYNAPGDYIVSLIVTDTNISASDTSSEMIPVRDVLDVPNVFTPNNDNINDLFIIRSNGVDTYTFTVFTRSGVRVYKTTGKTIVWDGRNPAGMYVSPGVYFYVLENDKGFCKKGFMQVIR